MIAAWQSVKEQLQRFSRKELFLPLTLKIVSIIPSPVAKQVSLHHGTFELTNVLFSSIFRSLTFCRCTAPCIHTRPRKSSSPFMVMQTLVPRLWHAAQSTVGPTMTSSFWVRLPWCNIFLIEKTLIMENGWVRGDL